MVAGLNAPITRELSLLPSRAIKKRFVRTSSGRLTVNPDQVLPGLAIINRRRQRLRQGVRTFVLFQENEDQLMLPAAA